MTRCPVPYALVALFGWGMFDALAAFGRARWRSLLLRLSPARATTGSDA